MKYGATTSKAHLDTLEFGVPGGEVDWDQITTWMDDAGAPEFAGRYFLGHPTDDELLAEPEAGLGFCLWAHGEGWQTTSPDRIVPIQRADPVRQATTGIAGGTYGRIDGEAFAAHLDRCLAVGDLEIRDTAQILVFLEVADGTELSIDYWSRWATAVYEAFLDPVREDVRAAWPVGTPDQRLQPLVPAIACAFEWDEDSESFLPEPSVRRCLDLMGPRGTNSRCRGLWARPKPGDPGLDERLLSWTTVGEYRQPRLVFDMMVYRRPVPVRYLRWFDGLDGLDDIVGDLRDTLGLVTLDWAAEGADDPLGATFRTTDWRVDRGADMQHLEEMPSQFGVDGGGDFTALADRLADNPIRLTELSYSGAGTEVDLEGPCRFAIRYYRTGRGSRLDLAESLQLGRRGIDRVAVFQHYARLDLGWATYVGDLIRPIQNNEGEDDAITAFTYAAEEMAQPPYTPVYFALDFPIGRNYHQGDPALGVVTPGMDAVLRYFRGIQRGLRRHLRNHPLFPYYVGVYGGKDALSALYQAGLATHFWQPPWAWTGFDEPPFRHLNMWQVAMDVTANAVADNPVLMAGGHFDLDVAWGDPGSFDEP